MNRAEEACVRILQILGEIPEIYDSNYEIVGRCDKEIQDILHEIELSEDKDMAGGYKLYRMLRESRRLRRQKKDENELLQPLVDLVRSSETFRQKLCKVHVQIKENMRQQDEREYKPRVRDDLSICNTGPISKDIIGDIAK